MAAAALAVTGQTKLGNEHSLDRLLHLVNTNKTNKILCCGEGPDRGHS